jgi:hypothetical protein
VRKLSVFEQSSTIISPTKAVSLIALISAVGLTAYSLYKLYQTLDKLDKIEFDFDTDLMLSSYYNKG